MPNLRLLVQSHLQKYGHPRTTKYGLISGSLLTLAALDAYVLQTRQWDRQLTSQVAVSDLVWYIALLLAAGMWFQLSWIVTHEQQKIGTSLNASGWAVTLAALPVSLAVVVLSFFERGPLLVLGFDPVTTVGFSIVVALAEFLALYILFAILGTVVCVVGTILSRLLQRGIVPRAMRPPRR
jgi:hypothetical protein